MGKLTDEQRDDLMTAFKQHLRAAENRLVAAEAEIKAWTDSLDMLEHIGK